MTERDRTKRLLRLAGMAVTALILLAVYGSVLRPWFLRWGATDSECLQQFPGDELTAHRAAQATRAITIHASAAQVWPWIVQIGQDRGGFYSYTWLENLFGCKMRNADRIRPDFQSRKVGDTVWLTPKERYGGRARVAVVQLTANQAMILSPPDDAEVVARSGRAPNGTWGFVLQPINEQSTRLIVCSRDGDGQGLFGRLFRWFIFDPAHFIMERKMLLGIKRRAEASATDGQVG